MLQSRYVITVEHYLHKILFFVSLPRPKFQTRQKATRILIAAKIKNRIKRMLVKRSAFGLTGPSSRSAYSGERSSEQRKHMLIMRNSLTFILTSYFSIGAIRRMIKSLISIALTHMVDAQKKRLKKRDDPSRILTARTFYCIHVSSPYSSLKAVWASNSGRRIVQAIVLCSRLLK